MLARWLGPTSAIGRRLSARGGAPRSGPRRPLVILYYNPDWLSPPQAGPLCSDGAGGCELTFDRSRFDEADAVIFHIPTLSLEQPLHKRPGQRWVATSMESEVNYPQLRDPEFMRWFDYTMTYRLDSDFPMLYFNDALARELLTPAQPKTEAALAVYMASNPADRSGRTEYVRELMRHIPIDSYGRCLQNRTLTEDHGRQTKLDT